MAGAASDQHHRGEMDISEQAATFRMVMGLTKWGSLAAAALLLFLVLWFCTHAGFMGAFIAAAVVLAVGVAFLRRGPEAAAAAAH